MCQIARDVFNKINDAIFGKTPAEKMKTLDKVGKLAFFAFAIYVAVCWIFVAQQAWTQALVFGGSALVAGGIGYLSGKRWEKLHKEHPHLTREKTVYTWEAYQEDVRGFMNGLSSLAASVCPSWNRNSHTVVQMEPLPHGDD